MANYDYSITVGATGSVLANVGNPPRTWDNVNKVYKLNYTTCRLQILTASYDKSVTLTGTRHLSVAVTGHIGEMVIDTIKVHILNAVGAVIEFLYQGAVVDSASLVNGVSNEYVEATYLTADYKLSWV
jgi:hypothetical protein